MSVRDSALVQLPLLALVPRSLDTSFAHACTLHTLTRPPTPVFSFPPHFLHAAFHTLARLQRSVTTLHTTNTRTHPHALSTLLPCPACYFTLPHLAPTTHTHTIRVTRWTSLYPPQKGIGRMLAFTASPLHLWNHYFVLEAAVCARSPACLGRPRTRPAQDRENDLF